MIATFERNRSQHCWEEHFAHVWPACCDMLWVEIELVRMPRRNIVAQAWPNNYNIMQHPQMLHEKFDQHPTCCNMLQQGGQTHNICYGLNLLPVQIFSNWFIFFKLVHIFQISLYFSNWFIFIKLVHIFQTGLKFLNQFNFQFWAECEHVSLVSNLG